MCRTESPTCSKTGRQEEGAKAEIFPTIISLPASLETPTVHLKDHAALVNKRKLTSDGDSRPDHKKRDTQRSTTASGRTQRHNRRSSSANTQLLEQPNHTITELRINTREKVISQIGNVFKISSLNIPPLTPDGYHDLLPNRDGELGQAHKDYAEAVCRLSSLTSRWDAASARLSEYEEELEQLTSQLKRYEERQFADICPTNDEDLKSSLLEQVISTINGR